MLLSRFGRFMLGLYPPFSPEDLRLTDVGQEAAGLHLIVSKVGMSEGDAERQRTYQQQQHDIRDQLQESFTAREHFIYERQHRGSA